MYTHRNLEFQINHSDAFGNVSFFLVDVRRSSSFFLFFFFSEKILPTSDIFLFCGGYHSSSSLVSQTHFSRSLHRNPPRMAWNTRRKSHTYQVQRTAHPDPGYIALSYRRRREWILCVSYQLRHRPGRWWFAMWSSAGLWARRGQTEKRNIFIGFLPVSQWTSLLFSYLCLTCELCILLKQWIS